MDEETQHHLPKVPQLVSGKSGIQTKSHTPLMDRQMERPLYKSVMHYMHIPLKNSLSSLRFSCSNTAPWKLLHRLSQTEWGASFLFSFLITLDPPWSWPSRRPWALENRQFTLLILAVPVSGTCLTQQCLVCEWISDWGYVYLLSLWESVDNILLLKSGASTPYI